jgi:hypothetical protein
MPSQVAARVLGRADALLGRSVDESVGGGSIGPSVKDE